MIGELAERAKALGIKEAERRIGCEMDEAFARSLVTVKYANGEFRVAPTEELDRCIAALW